MSRPFACAVLLVTLFSGCLGSTGPAQKITELPRALTSAETRIIRASNRFTFDLLRETDLAEDGQHNVFVSPLSVSMALGMTLNGAAGSTFEAMRSTLRFEDLSQDAINASYRGLLDLLRNLDPTVDLEVANSVWARDGFSFEPTFFQSVQTFFDAVVETLDFSDPAAPDVINAWVASSTNGRIDEIVESISPLDIMFIINAIYFDGSWTYQFDRDRTQPSGFELESGEQVTVNMMSGDMPVGRGARSGIEIGELTYGGEAFALDIVLPPPGQGVSDLLASLDEETWSILLASIDAPDEQLVQLPTFEMEYETFLRPVLAAMGMEVAFSPFDADFSRLTPAEDAHISDVRHKTFLSIDEEGTEAAAVTSVNVRVTSLPPQFRVDRPFVLILRERLSGTILFAGAIRDPR